MSISREKLADGGEIVHLQLDHPETRNSLTLEMGLAFHRELHALAGEFPLPRACVISGKNGVFSSGGDFQLLSSFAEKSPKDNQEFMQSFYRLFLSVRNMPFPVLAAVNGHAVGAALAVALACDLRYFVPDGKYSLNFVRIGIHPGMGSSFLVKEIAGLPRAQELLLTGRYFSGKEAFDMGLCHGLHPVEEIVPRVMDVAREIAAGAPLAVRLAKKSLYSSTDLETAIETESRFQAETYQTRDFREALKSIGEKRKPTFKDE
ncbi:MAG: enoyl-CoA hydratase/isomerase family protein [Leptospirales bacterium]|nr:enoyl-CoA hydratase/isomerase family protein [Leptospirales bacterium]